MTTTNLDRLKTHSFSTIFEPSGLVHLGEGEFLIIEDEQKHSFHRVTLSGEGHLQEQGEIRVVGDAPGLNDLEGLSYDGQFVYAITSHSLTKKGKPGKGRTALARYQYEDGSLHSVAVVQDLNKVILQQFKAHFPALSPKEISKKVNIEALSWSTVSHSLLVGFRTPVIAGRSLIMQIDQPQQMFERGSAVGVQSRLIMLELDGHGIRAMHWDAHLQRFLIVAGDKKSSDGEFMLWLWSGDQDSPPLKIRGLPKGTEGLTSFYTKEQSGLLLVLDNGKRNKHRPAHYGIVPFASFGL